MRKLKTILLFILFAGTLTTCKKYPDSTCHGGRGNEKVLAGKDKSAGKWWVLESININDADSTQQFLNNHNYVYYLNFSRELRDPGGQKWIFGQDINSTTIWSYPGTATWKFDKNENIFTSNFLFYPNSSTPSFQYQNQTWEVRNLCDDKFWFKFDYQGKAYYFKYNAK